MWMCRAGDVRGVCCYHARTTWGARSQKCTQGTRTRALTSRAVPITPLYCHEATSSSSGSPWRSRIPTGTTACSLRVRGIQVARLPLSPGAEVEASSWIASPAPSLHLRTGGDATARYVSLGRPRLSPRAAHISRAFPVAQRNIRRHVVVALSLPSSSPPLVAPRLQ